MNRKRAKTLHVVALGYVVGCLVLLLPGSTRAAIFCVSTAAELQAALTTAASNGEDDVIHIVQGTYNGNFVYASTEAFNLTVEGGYAASCSSRVVDPANTVLDGLATGRVSAIPALP